MHLTTKTLYEGTLYCGLATLGVYALWIEPYLRRYLIKPSPFALLLIAPIIDYLKVRRLSRKRSFTPWFVRVYEALIWLTALGAVASLVVYIVLRMKSSA